MLRGMVLVSLLVLNATNCTVSRAAAPRIAVPSTGEEFEVEHVRANVEFLLRILNGESEGTLEDASLLLGRDDGPEERAERRCCGERFAPSDAASIDDRDLSSGCVEWLVDRRRDWARSPSIYFRALRASLKDPRPLHLDGVRFDRDADVFVVEVRERDDEPAFRVEHAGSVAKSDLRLLRILDLGGIEEFDPLANSPLPWGSVCRPEADPESGKPR